MVRTSSPDSVVYLVGTVTQLLCDSAFSTLPTKSGARISSSSSVATWLPVAAASPRFRGADHTNTWIDPFEKRIILSVVGRDNHLPIRIILRNQGFDRALEKRRCVEGRRHHRNAIGEHRAIQRPPKEAKAVSGHAHDVLASTAHQRRTREASTH